MLSLVYASVQRFILFVPFFQQCAKIYSSGSAKIDADSERDKNYICKFDQSHPHAPFLHRAPLFHLFGGGGGGVRDV